MNSLCSGALFDFDGVLFDSERHHELAWLQVAKERGQPITRDQFLRGFGVKNYRFIDEILQWSHDPEEILSIERRKEELFIERIRTHVIDPIEGTVDLVYRLHEASIPCCIGSSSILLNIELVLKPHPSLRAMFSGIISAENVSAGKPNPEVFLKGAALLGSGPQTTVVFEDAPLGIEAGKRAGMKVIGLTTTFSKEILARSNPDAIVGDFRQLSITDIQKLFG